MSNFTWLFGGDDEEVDALFLNLLKSHPASCALFEEDLEIKLKQIVYHASFLVGIVEEAIEKQKFIPERGLDPRFSIEHIKHLAKAKREQE